MKKTAYVERRTQKSKGSSRGGFGGPDIYFAVQVVPEGQERLKVLNHHVAKLRGIEILYCGEGYSDRMKSERSMARQALAEAERIAEEINNAQPYNGIELAHQEGCSCGRPECSLS